MACWPVTNVSAPTPRLRTSYQSIHNDRKYQNHTFNHVFDFSTLAFQIESILQATDNESTQQN